MSDGCTLFVNVWRNINIRECCDIHDLDFYNGNSFLDFILANIDLSTCFVAIGAIELAIPAFLATCTFGALYFLFGSKAPKK